MKQTLIDSIAMLLRHRVAARCGKWLVAVAMTMLCVNAYCAGPEWVWPIEGRNAGEDILYSPQQYIGEERNFGDLFIGGEIGDSVVCPVDGTLSGIFVGYMFTLTYSATYGYDAARPMSEQVGEIAAKAPKTVDKRSITGTVGIRTDDGRVVYLSGIMLNEGFKTGQRIVRGQRLGTLHYSYHAINSPSLKIAVSSPKGQSDDPMTPFGLRTTFVPPAKRVVKQQLTEEEAIQDFNTIMNVLKEAYPSLDDAVSPEELAAFEAGFVDSLRGGISRNKFYYQLYRLQAKVHDSHFLLYPNEQRNNNQYLPRVFFGWFGDSCIVTMAKRDNADLVGRRIVSVDDLPVDSVRQLKTATIGGYDGRIESVIDQELAIFGTRLSADNDLARQKIEFADGEVRSFTGFRSNGNPADFTNTYIGYLRANIYYPDMYRLRMIDDSTAYVGISSFSLNETQTDEIVGFIDSVSMVPNLIVDLRNNRGGDVEVLGRILSCLLNEPGRNKGAECMVTKQGNFESFAGCCLNYTEDMEIFPEYRPVEGREGFFTIEYNDSFMPDSTVQYRGRIYVLTNASSCSAATIFPAAIVRNHRGVVVGRETGTTYHYMTALKFADIVLPNSGFQFKVPLVRCIYDTTSNDRIPYGRGVLPDYPVDLTYEEAYSRPDSILNYALQLIDEGRYFTGDDPFAANDAPVGRRSRLAGYIAIGCALLAAVLFLSRRSKKR